MTLKGKQNHYNIKFLKGYGHSISVKDSKIILKDYARTKNGAVMLDYSLIKRFLEMPICSWMIF